MAHKPLIGLLYNPFVLDVVAHAPQLVEYLEVIPERLWYDFGATRRRAGRFQRVESAVEAFKQCAQNRVVAGHGIGLSLPSDMPIDTSLVTTISALASELRFEWYSEHLSVFVVANGRLPNAQAGLGLPIAYDDDALDLLTRKLRTLRRALGCDLLLENPAVFTQVPDSDMSEPEFFNRLYATTQCGMLLDLHNLYVSFRNGGPQPDQYLQALDPACVSEIHLAGGDTIANFYTDSHSRLSPVEVWDLAREWAPRFKNVRALVFEFHESYFDRLGLAGITGELERMHELSEAMTTPNGVLASC